MRGGTLLISRNTNLLSHYKTRLEALGFPDVHVTDKDKDALNMLINEINPYYVLIGSHFYNAATPYMTGQLLKKFSKLHIAAITTSSFPDELAAFFIFHGVECYINLLDGKNEFHYGLSCFLRGEKYIAPSVQKIIDIFPALPEVKLKAGRRELEVLVMLCNGNSPEDIAACLDIKKRTVDTHIEELRKVFHVHTRDQLISFAFFNDIVTKQDMCFFMRNKIANKKTEKWPKWAETKLAMSNIKNK